MHARGPRRTDERMDRRAGRGAGGGAARRTSETERLLRVAREVAHRVERKDTPLAAYLLGLPSARRTASRTATRATPSTTRSRPRRRAPPAPRPNGRSAEHAVPGRLVGMTDCSRPVTPPPARARWSTRSAASPTTCGSRSPTGATSGARTACRPRGSPGCPKSELLTFEEIDPAARHLRPAGRPSLKVTGGEPHGPRRPPDARPDVPGGRARPRHLDHHERHAARQARGAARRGRHRPRDRLVRLAAAPPVPGDDPARRARQGPGRAAAAEAAGLTPIKINTRRDRRHERRRGRRLRAVVARDRLRGAVHRVHAAGRAARLGAREGRPGAHGSSRRSTPSTRSSPRPRDRAGGDLPLRRRRARADRRDRQRHRAVLRHVQPAAADRRGAVPQLPVRAGGDGPARAAARRRLRRRARAR